MIVWDLEISEWYAFVLLFGDFWGFGARDFGFPVLGLVPKLAGAFGIAQGAFDEGAAQEDFVKGGGRGVFALF